jgi:hypothetical protein
MRCGVLVAGLALLLPDLRAGMLGDDFAAISRKNAFRLSPPKPAPKPVEMPPELPQVSLQGLTTLLDLRQALLKIQMKRKTGVIEVPCILGEGQARDGIKVLRIDMKSETVWLLNQDSEQVLSLKP